MCLSKYARIFVNMELQIFQSFVFLSQFYKICEAARHYLKANHCKLVFCLLLYFFQALQCSSLKFSLLLLPLLLSRLSLLKYLKFFCIFLGALFCSLSCCSSLNVISRQKYAGCQMQRCHMISRQGKLSKHSCPQRLPCPPPLHPDSLYRWTDRRTLTS